VNFNHRDRAAYNDNNRGTLNTVDMLDAGATFSMLDERLTLGIYGKNLTNQVIEGNDSPLAGAAYSGVIGSTDPLISGAYRPLMKGRVYGVELNYRL
jgi:iron complex outermembrane receptor protein